MKYMDIYRIVRGWQYQHDVSADIYPVNSAEIAIFIPTSVEEDILYDLIEELKECGKYDISLEGQECDLVIGITAPKEKAEWYFRDAGRYEIEMIPYEDCSVWIIPIREFPMGVATFDEIDAIKNTIENKYNIVCQDVQICDKYIKYIFPPTEVEEDEI